MANYTPKRIVLDVDCPDTDGSQVAQMSIVDMRETVTAMDSHVKQMFPDEYEAYQKTKAAAAGQPSLI